MSNMARRKRGTDSTALLFSLLLSVLRSGFTQILVNEVTGFSLHPPYFNIAEGARISATATCGEDEAARPKSELYCKLVGGPTAGLPSQTIQGQYCDYCNSNDPNKAYPITTAIDGTERWWQSPPLSRGLEYNKVNVTLDLGQLFHVAYVLIKFANSPRPDLWVLERSVDFGRTYTPWQYFAHSKRDCIETFGKDPKHRVVKDDDQICTTEYSRIVPLENGEIVVSLVNGRPGAKNFSYSPVLRDFTKATNIRLRFLRTNTLLGHLISKEQRDPTVTRRYYYSIKDISVGGRCVCHGHAQVCDARNSENRYQLQCDCQHNTCGESCERCCPGYNQKPWRAATTGSANQCEPCNCHSHASECYYNPEVDRRGASLNINGKYEGGGVCINCQHNTAGINCERCSQGYYRPYGAPKESPYSCTPCRCDPQYTDSCEEGSGRCYCKPNFSGENCDQCAEGHFGFPQCVRTPIYRPTKDPSAEHIVETNDCPAGYFGPPNCQPCQCSGPGVLEQTCGSQTGECRCRPEFQGRFCDRCAVQHFNYPYCQACTCNTAGTQPQVCDATGRCLCRQEVEGSRCDQCRPGYHSFPNCDVCSCDGFGAVDNICGPRGQCRCKSNYVGLTCSQCAPGHYEYPSCFPCQCSPDGSYQISCDQVSGQCSCRPGVTGQRCDRCAAGGFDFPRCQVSHCDPAGTEINVLEPQLPDVCQCLPDVEGPTCNKCKPLYWNLAPENPTGCIECQCDVKGTISGVGQCQQKNGQCFCKPNTCSHTCNTCKAGYFWLERRNYFGCRGCQCDIGGSASLTCDERSGTCSCRKNVEGRTCNQPEKGYYFPDLHHLKYEIEDGTTPNGRTVRFGYDPQEFPGFSWRGYATMSPAQPEVVLPVTVPSPSPYHIIVHYATPTSKRALRGMISVAEEVHFHSCCNWPVQRKEILFPSSPEPAFITVPGSGFAQSFPLTPGKWIVSIKAEGVLLDYLVLLPSNYFEAPILQLKVTEPCSYETTQENNHKNCLLYKHIPMDRFPSVLGTEGLYSVRGRRKRQARVRQPTPEHPEMAVFNGRQAKVQLRLRVPRPGKYVVVLEYSNEEDTVQNVNVLLNNLPGAVTQGRANIYSCKYSFLCRSVVVDGKNRIAVYDLPNNAELLLQASTANFLLYKVYVAPAEDFSTEYVNPKVHCIATHGHFTEKSSLCVTSQFEVPPTAILLDAVKDGRLSYGSEASQSNVLHRNIGDTGALSPLNPRGEGVLLKSPQNQITFKTRVPSVDRYVFVVHFRQPEHPSFPVEVLVDGGRPWVGSFNASFCPHTSGCRDQVIAENRIALDVTDQELLVNLKVPNGKTLTVGYILVIPENNYSPDQLDENSLDQSSDFINNCGGNSFYIDPLTSTQFCKDSAKSLVAFFNDGALPCYCDMSGATSPNCNPAGGQCSCRSNVIGRQCSRCATGFYGFPYCKPCSCGRRLCDEVTGQCICPPQTVKPLCDVCETQAFSYHPLVGCEGCNCSRTGIINTGNTDCDRGSGQCKCKPRIAGRQCNRCVVGSYGFPNCNPCDCNQGGTQPDVCDPHTGQCLCKENVQGTRCDTCRPGSFYFDPANPKGCTSCFCFGASDQCEGTDQRRSKFVDMKMWRLEKLNKEGIPVVFNPGSSTVVADVQELPVSVHDLYWVAPPSYFGDRVSSYGGYLTYQVKSFGLPSEGMVLLEKRPDVQLSGQHMTLLYLDPQNPSPDRLYQGRVQLVEGNFRHATTNSPVSREELMMVLAGLDGLRIRALYFTESQRLALGEVGLEGVSPTGSGVTASNVEVCTCPAEDRGDSCQKCAPGYYRDNKGLYLGRCVPCFCNGHSNTCEDGSGKCLNCLRNTAGDNCERCMEGYYGNATQGTCQVCPCPLAITYNSFATSCKEVGGRFECLCKPGYTGSKCQWCAPGYYGDPIALNGKCSPCNCGNNGNPGNCDSLTGVCRNMEPKDTSTDEMCDECDSCVQTLTDDLERMDRDLADLKAQLQNVNASAFAQERMKKLEKNIEETKNLLNRYRSNVTSQRLKVNELESGTIDLTQDITILGEKADKNSKNTQTVFNNIEQTNQRARDLVSEVQGVWKRIQELLAQLKDTNSGGSGLPSGDIGKKLAEAERMVREMEQRDFNTQKMRAEREREEAQKLLNRVKNNLVKQLEENQRKSEKVSDLLKQYDTKLNDLRDALKEASGAVDKANQLNRGNLLALSDIKTRMQELKQEKEKVEDQVKLAKVQLDQTNDLLRKLDESRVEYERLAAQLDGAKSELGDKVKELSQVGSKEDIVLKAEEHARNLDRQAKELQEAVKNASSNSAVRCAVDGIEAYKNITDAIKAAEDAANRAKEAADNALNTVQQEDLNSKGKKLRDDGDKLLNDAKNTEAKLKEAIPELNNLNKRFEVAKNKEKTLQNDLRSAQDELGNIKRDDISDTINRAKDMAGRAQDKVGDVMNKLNPIKTEVDKIKNSNGASPVDPNLNKVLDEVDQSVKNLSSAIPTLLDKMDKVEEMSRQLTPSSNISDNVERIKELIKQARDAANKIVVPMIFNGNSHVEVQPPRNLEDLKAYTSLSLYLHRPVVRGDRRRQTDSGNMFVMYLGKKDASTDYIGMALRDNTLFCVYNLRGKELEIQMDTEVAKSPQDQSILDKVKFERIYQNAKLLYTKSSTSTSPENQPPITKDGDYTDNLLNLDPNDVVFYVGGFPAEFKPPRTLNLPKYKGCIELDALNDEVISLYNFKKVYNVNVDSPCKRYKEGSDQYFFEGTGFARIDLKDKFIGQYEFTIQTNSDNALLFYIENEKNHFIVTLEQGKVVWRGKVENMQVKETRTSEKIFNGNDAVRMVIYLRDKQFIISMGSNLIRESIDIQGPFSEYYIGGVTTSIRKSKNINIPPLRGCVKNMKHPSGNAELRDTVGISRGCSSDSLLARFASVGLGGYLDVAPNGFELTNDVVVGLGFRTTQTNVPLLQNSQAGSKLDLRLNENGFVTFNLDGKILKTDKNYGDGKWHYLVATKNSEGTKLIVDETEEGKVGPRSTSDVQNNKSNIYLGKDQFDGCITDVYLKRSTAPYDVEDLRTYSKTENVSLGVCNTEEPPQSIMLKKNWSRTNLNRDKPVKVCRLPKTTSGAYHLSLLSGLVYDFNPKSLQEGSHFSVDIRTNSEEGLIFFIGSEHGASHLALYISNGRIVFSLSSSEKKRRISIKEKYNDGQWHTVMFGRVGNSSRLVIDGLKAQNGSFPQGSSIELRSPMYLGSLPASYSGTSGLKNIPNHSIVGCVRNLKVNGQKMSAPTGNRRVAPCFVGRTESGVYFSGNHGYVDFGNTNDVGMDFQLVFEVHPRSLTGVLFHFRGQSGDHLSLFLNNGQVTAMVKNGMGNFSTSVTPQQSLCDGMFHRIAVNKGRNVIQVDVDTKHNYTVGTLHSQSTDTEHLYIGGIPDTVPSPILPVSTSFVGCLQNLQINGSPVSFNRAEVHGPVILSGCPLA
ncbi:laminin subunit alpha-3-like isoform X1 [Acipenser ruthenus]|uniref:laminin subunit alpha-3-like isoform X1 n=1 Tax=Acipenser ruthenus TaxID=7906 RepID=UPI0027422369|nr:laminin subunit alpha-3-like isoform X1 [Acipenser ruthenus]